MNTSTSQQKKTDELEMLIQKKALSQREIARLTGIRRAYLNECLRTGKPLRITPLQMQNLCDVLECSLEELVAAFHPKAG